MIKVPMKKKMNNQRNPYFQFTYENFLQLMRIVLKMDDREFKKFKISKDWQLGTYAVNYFNGIVIAYKRGCRHGFSIEMCYNIGDWEHKWTDKREVNFIGQIKNTYKVGIDCGSGGPEVYVDEEEIWEQMLDLRYSLDKALESQEEIRQENLKQREWREKKRQQYVDEVSKRRQFRKEMKQQYGDVFQFNKDNIYIDLQKIPSKKLHEVLSILDKEMV